MPGANLEITSDDSGRADISEGVYVQSRSMPNVLYHLVHLKNRDEWFCPCPGFWFNGECRHLSDRGIKPECQHYWADIHNTGESIMARCSRCGLRVVIYRRYVEYCDRAFNVLDPFILSEE